VKLAFFNELYLTLQTDFAARWCFCFSANDSSVEQVCPPLLLGMLFRLITGVSGSETTERFIQAEVGELVIFPPKHA